MISWSVASTLATSRKRCLLTAACEPLPLSICTDSALSEMSLAALTTLPAEVLARLLPGSLTLSASLSPDSELSLSGWFSMAQREAAASSPVETQADGRHPISVHATIPLEIDVLEVDQVRALEILLVLKVPHSAGKLKLETLKTSFKASLNGPGLLLTALDVSFKASLNSPDLLLTALDVSFKASLNSPDLLLTALDLSFKASLNSPDLLLTALDASFKASLNSLTALELEFQLLDMSPNGSLNNLDLISKPRAAFLNALDAKFKVSLNSLDLASKFCTDVLIVLDVGLKGTLKNLDLFSKRHTRFLKVRFNASFKASLGSLDVMSKPRTHFLNMRFEVSFKVSLDSLDVTLKPCAHFLLLLRQGRLVRQSLLQLLVELQKLGNLFIFALEPSIQVLGELVLQFLAKRQHVLLEAFGGVLAMRRLVRQTLLQLLVELQKLGNLFIFALEPSIQVL
eukprot:CAMPEP_0206520442 /NCGR_PEP_ID=MMETSP0324_2-20121206/65759_1 /ASSEMBLY_ACC=CAM_ASM_000836 /TAXON_ID=2866 /ORGANISM="Crypthecodinium cohnii, Strain Seligo" /LENGTH=455 /DNA_ID=CAMNT_0054014155 /DNA_START=166 /DNA_END=1533 /DNA_ORIENTATION=+